MPVVGDEVLIAFEHDDVHKPYVIGSLWNGKETPGELVQKDGSFKLASDKQIGITSKEDIQIKGDKDFSLETTGKITEKAKGEMSVDGSMSISVKAGTTLTIEGTAGVTIKCGAAKIDMTAAGSVSVSGTSIMLG
jgi:uncharacterized protein involved in type VI secretion and phage assembly